MKFKLIKAAAKSGGDKYECEDFVIYVPQSISRKSGSPAPVLEVTINADTNS